MFEPCSDLSRREFLQRSAAVAAGAPLLRRSGRALADSRSATHRNDPSGKGRIYKAVKWDMIAGGSSVLDKFKLQKELGYDGMELVSPWQGDVDEVRKASDATGMPVHALVDMKHWDVRLSSPDAKVREQGIEILKQ